MDGRTDGSTDGRTDKAGCRVAQHATKNLIGTNLVKKNLLHDKENACVRVSITEISNPCSTSKVFSSQFAKNPQPHYHLFGCNCNLFWAAGPMTYDSTQGKFSGFRLSVRPSVCLSHFTFFGFLLFLASLLLPRRSGDLNYSPCPPARDCGSRVSGLVSYLTHRIK